HIAYGQVLLDLVTQRHTCVDFVPISPAVSSSVDGADLLQVPHDSLDGALGDAHALRDVAQPHDGVSGQAHQYVRVIRQESPGAVGSWTFLTGCGQVSRSVCLHLSVSPGRHGPSVSDFLRSGAQGINPCLAKSAWIT